MSEPTQNGGGPRWADCSFCGGEMYAYGSHTCNPNKVRVDGLPSLSPSPKNAIDPEEVVAQERMYDLRGKMDSLRAIIDLADKHYEQTIEERRALLYKFPGLRFGTREKAATTL